MIRWTLSISSPFINIYMDFYTEIVFYGNLYNKSVCASLLASVT